MMTLVHDDLAAEFGATAEDILARLSTNKEVAAELERDGFSRTAWSATTDAGWFEAILSESAGGLGLSMRELGPIFTAAGRHLFIGPLAEHAVAGALAASVARPAARDRVLAALRGSELLAVVDTAGAGIDAAPQLAARRLTGSSELVRFAAESDVLLVVADTVAGPVVVLVGRDVVGVEVTARPSLDPATAMARVRFHDVEVGDDNLLACGEDAVALIADLRAGMRIAIACTLSGIAGHALALAVDYAKERQQFGRVIGSFQALQHILAEMAREAFGLDRLCREASAVTDAKAIEEAALVAKAHAASAARSVTEGSLQVHGGIAFTVEHELHRYYKHLLFLEGFYGDRSEIYELLGRRLLAGGGEVWPGWR